MTRAETAANTDSPFTIIVDSREQKPYAYPNAKVKGLHTGDYSIEGMESLIVIERKSKSDAYASLGANRARFEQEWRRMAEVDHAVVVIESDLKDFLTPPPHTLMSPIAAINTLISWSIKYRVQVFFASDRRHARSMVRRILEKYWKHYNATLSAESEAGKLLTQEDINVDRPVTQSLNATPSPNATPPQSYRAIVSEWWRECNDADIEPLIKALEDTPCPSCGKLRLYAMNATPPQSHKTIVNKWWIVETDESHDESLGDEPLLTCKSEILLEGAHD